MMLSDDFIGSCQEVPLQPEPSYNLQHSKEASLQETEYILQGNVEPSAPGMFEFDELIHSAKSATNFESAKHSRQVSNKQTAEFPTSQVSLLEQEVQRIREDTLRRQSMHVNQHMHDLNYQRYLMRNELGRLSSAQSAAQSSSGTQRGMPPDSALPSEILVCDTRIKRMKNLLIEAKKKIGPPLIITHSTSSKHDSLDAQQQPQPPETKPPALDQLTQWRSDLELVRESLQKLSEEKLSAILQSQASPTFGGGAPEPFTQPPPLGRAEGARFDSDETYLAFLGVKPSEDYPQREQLSTPSSSQLSGYFPNMQYGGGSVLVPASSLLEQQSTKHRDESIERRVREAKVNLEWKIALKLKQRLQQNVVEEEDKLEDEIIPPLLNEESKPDTCVPSHIVKTLQKSRQNAIKRLNVLQQHSHDGQQVGLNSVDSLGGRTLSSAYSTNSQQQVFKCPQGNVGGRKIPTSSIKLKRQGQASTTAASPSQTVQRRVGSNAHQGIILHLSHDPTATKVLKISRPGSPDYAGDERPVRKPATDCWNRLAKPLKIVQKVQQRTAATSSERESVAMLTPVKKLSVVKLVKPPTGQKPNNNGSPQATKVETRRAFSTQKKVINLDDNRQSIRVVAQSQVHSRNQSIAPPSKGDNEKRAVRSYTKPTTTVRPSSVQRPSTATAQRASSISAASKSSPRSAQTRTSMGFGSKQPRTSAVFSPNRENAVQPTKQIVRKSSPPPSTTTHQTISSNPQPRQTIFSDKTKQLARTNLQRPALHPGTQILLQQESTDWVRNCDQRIMRFIATSPSKNTKTRLLSSLSQQRTNTAEVKVQDGARQIVVGKLTEQESEKISE
ncbi:hypothetical protein FGO68_gene8959 [Halteria grandinella]|uniref:Uncharacterized protein n=1 Tax=Halteria grandinella TaxID=5974 RepID=A0A8J8TA85_HALGN|nr:hypothetical protein FGO68_gene8959 [Halteria grandinella]